VRQIPRTPVLGHFQLFQPPIAKEADESAEGEDVLLVEDILYTGFTLRHLLRTLAGRAHNSLTVCTFMDCHSRRIVRTPVKYRCFERP
jgi:hypoxanthine-guanine phosphoribosyltransferase